MEDVARIFSDAKFSLLHRLPLNASPSQSVKNVCFTEPIQGPTSWATSLSSSRQGVD